MMAHRNALKLLELLPELSGQALPIKISTENADDSEKFTTLYSKVYVERKRLRERIN